ncbi:hypothetical protein BKA70DRAFT_750710 [Coprinopsis sp. MPI-PUGE-AT-0042]|nr:hypothetical protein BKA70DRAFT_750710 [Coprinopsis sp. MPI-PUGE-AT-0042]
MGFEHSRTWSTDDLRAEIDAKIAALEQQLLDLRARRNRLAKIYSLPPELLYDILVRCKNAPYQPVITNPQPPNRAQVAESLSWIQVTHVSRQLRQTSLDFPSLWTEINITSPPWAEEMLRRSGTLPLNITLPEILYDKTEAVALPTLSDPTRSRIQDMTIVSSDSKYQNLINKYFTTPMLNLEGLRLVMACRRPLSIPANFLGGETTNLRRLLLDSTHVASWSSPSLKGLVSLSVDFTYPSARPSPTNFLEPLEQMEALSELSINFNLRDIASLWQNATPRKAALRNLKSLVFVTDDETSTAVTFLNHLSLPLSTSFHLVITEFDLANAGGPLASALQAASWSNPLVDPGVIPLPKSLLVDGEGPLATLSCWLEEVDFEDISNNINSRYLHVQLSNSVIFDGLVETFSLTNLCNAHVNIVSIISFLINLPQLRSLSLRGTPPAYMFKEYLQKSITHFPALHQLSLAETAFNSFGGIPLDQWVDVLKRRGLDDSVPDFKILILKESFDLSDSVVDTMRQALPSTSKVEWDGVIRDSIVPQRLGENPPSPVYEQDSDAYDTENSDY